MSQTPQFKEVLRVYQNLNQDWNKKNPDLEACGDKLSQLKIGLTQLSYLPTLGSQTSKQELLIARDVLEIGARWSIEKRDIPSFERYMSQLKNYYFDYKSDLPESPYKYELLGLNLLRLLAQRRLADFHTELERLTVEDINDNVYIKHPVSMEQYLMEGSYNKVFLSKDNVPSERYNFFIDILLNTTRDEIASCIQKAYRKLHMSEAAHMLFFDNNDAMKEYGEKREWQLAKDGNYLFADNMKETDGSIPSNDVTEKMIEYAKELDKIV